MMRAYFAGLSLALFACGSDPDPGPGPTDVEFGTTALVVVVNPVLNDGNTEPVPTPGGTRAGVVLSSDDGVEATTGANGIAVLAPLTAGTRTITLSGTSGGAFTVNMTAGELREVAVATDGVAAQIMVNLDYKSGQVVELTPTSTPSQVSAALAVSDNVVFFRGGLYVGDIDFAGSRVTLFGEGVLGGKVTLQGNVTISGSDSRIRGARITGNLTVPASGAGLSFSRVDGSVTSTGSDMTFLANSLCGTDSITGSGTLVVGNAGVAPTTSCP